ncbi:MAG: rRNA (cytidine-2-O)-methyltransferase TlyA [Actinomycetota bacterium]
MASLRRLDAELVRRKLARSRTEAQALIAEGSVIVDGVASLKAARQVAEGISIVVKETSDSKWVSRGAHKLLGALAAFEPQGLSLEGSHVLDAGASTGGFTQVALSKGAQSVLAVDVGYGQLAWELRQDERVICLERFNIRNLTLSDLPHAIDVVVADLSFISLRTVLPALIGVLQQGASLALMVKPQFEVGREAIGDGVVRDPALRASAVQSVIEVAQQLGAGLRGVAASPLPGPEGNVEYFVWLEVGAAQVDSEQVASAVTSAVEGGPR